MLPALTGVLFDSVLPAGDRPQLLQLTLVLLAAALGQAGFAVTRSIALLRIEGRVDAALQPAVWDRLLTLPAPFFRRFTAGDLASRAAAVGTIRQLLSGATADALLVAVFSAWNMGLLFYLDRHLALWALVPVSALLLVVGLAAWRMLAHQRPAQHVRQRLAGRVLQYVASIAKLRVTASEPRAFARWAEEYVAQRRLELRARLVRGWMSVGSTAVPITGALLVYWRAAHEHDAGALQTGVFLGFSAALGGFLAAVGTLGESLLSALAAVPLWDSARPILDAEPEEDPVKDQAARLSGHLEVVRVSFRYDRNAAPVLDDVSLEVRPGEFVALVGPSGCGKSTLFRLLLGFERPESGSILLDGQGLDRLDPVSVRRQMGVVLQNGRLLPGTVFSNIVGASVRFGLDDAWEAARMAGLEPDIREMPMGMQTAVSEETLSGGQKQRLMIARALVHRPRVVLMDEATSALDNPTQRIVARSLDGLRASRIVIAHRLSTVRNADRIVVMRAGRIAESGRYDELMANGGEFARLASRQLA
jgi:ATP-binding cassette subfamily C protein